MISASLLSVAALVGRASGALTDPAAAPDRRVDPDWTPGFDAQQVLADFKTHKRLFTDEAIPSGDISMLLRAADAHQRYVTPLELQTYGASLPGRETAGLIYLKNQAAMDFARQALLENIPHMAAEGPTATPDSKRMHDILLEDLSRFQRMLQYGVAVNLHNIVAESDLQKYIQLYQEYKIDVGHLVSGLKNLAKFYERFDKAAYEAQLKSHFDSLIAKLLAAAGAAKNNPLGAKSPPGLVEGDAQDLAHQASLLVDPRMLDLAAFSEAERDQVVAVAQRWRAAAPL